MPRRLPAAEWLADRPRGALSAGAAPPGGTDDAAAPAPPDARLPPLLPRLPGEPLGAPAPRPPPGGGRTGEGRRGAGAAGPRGPGADALGAAGRRRQGERVRARLPDRPSAGRREDRRMG